MVNDNLNGGRVKGSHYKSLSASTGDEYVALFCPFVAMDERGSEMNHYSKFQQIQTSGPEAKQSASLRLIRLYKSDDFTEQRMVRSNKFIHCFCADKVMTLLQRGIFIQPRIICLHQQHLNNDNNHLYL